MANVEVLTGQRFGRLLVFERVQHAFVNTRWRCVCDCGKETVAISGNLKNGRHKSCGCLRAGPTSQFYKEKTISQGYSFLRIDGHHRAHPTSGRVREHIVVMESMLGRRLLPKEEVHHKNAIRNDNRPENLELWSRSQPAGARVTDLIEHAEYILRTYAPEKLK